MKNNSKNTQLGYSFQNVTNKVKEVKEFPNYLITSDGQVYSLRSKKFLTPFINNSGYKFVYLSKDGVAFKKYIHRLVAEEFWSKEGMEVNHIDGDKLNNHKNNLEWCSRSQNMAHAHQMGLTLPFMIEVINTETKEIFKSIKDAAARVGVSLSYLSRMLNGHCVNFTNLEIKKNLDI